ncbi:MAG: nitroreductase family deazaflavin-dependent oxidoreductase [Ilumatobacteraceae bacterium]
MEDKKIVDSPTEWVADHIRRYVESGGEDGHIWRGVPTLLLTTTGRKSGMLRRTALIYGIDGSDYVIVASKGGHPTNPLWFENLVDDSNVEIQVGPQIIQAHASVITDESRYQRVWDQMVTVWPGFNEYKEKTSRLIPLVALTPS